MLSYKPNLSSGSSRCIPLGGKVFTPCEFERHAGKSASRNWKALIRYCGKPLLNFIESYESPDGKKRCRFVISGCHFVSPDSSVVTQQDDAVTDSLQLSNNSDISSQDQSSIHIDNSTKDQSSNNTDNLFQNPSHYLPDFVPSTNPVFTWGSVDSDTFCHSLESAYTEVVHWRINCYKIPSGNLGKKFVLELARLFLICWGGI